MMRDYRQGQARYELAGDCVRYVSERPDEQGRMVVHKQVRVCGADEELAISWDGAGVLVAHGARPYVEAKAAALRFGFAHAGLHDEAEGIQLAAFPPDPAAIEELNACIACTGRVARFAERLAEIGGASVPVPGPR